MLLPLSLFHTTHTTLALGFVISEKLVDNFVKGNGHDVAKCGGLLSKRLSRMGENCEGLQST